MAGLEECDDGNTEDNDGCSSLCKLEDAFDQENIDQAVNILTAL